MGDWARVKSGSMDSCSSRRFAEAVVVEASCYIAREAQHCVREVAVSLSVDLSDYPALCQSLKGTSAIASSWMYLSCWNLDKAETVIFSL